MCYGLKTYKKFISGIFLFIFFQLRMKNATFVVLIQNGKMKNILWILVLLLVGCTPSYHSMIEDAERLLQEGKSDSALTVIHSIRQPEELEQPWRARYALAMGQAHEETGRATTEDSLLCEAYEYYRTTGEDSTRLIHSAALLASYYHWRGEKDKAYRLLGEFPESHPMIQNVLFGLYGVNEEYAPFKRMIKERISRTKEEGRSLFSDMHNLGVAHFYLEELDSALSVFKDIESRIQTKEDSSFYWKQTIGDHAELLSVSGDQQKAIELQMRRLGHFKGENDTETSKSYASLARYYILTGDFKQAEEYLRLANETATDKLMNDLTYASYYQILDILLDYARTRNFNFNEWASFVNGLGYRAKREQKITDAKEEANRLLAERNLHLTIDRQRTQIMAMYLSTGLVLVIVFLFLYNRRKKRLVEEKEEELEALRKLVTESQQQTERTDDRFFKKVMLQQLGVIRMAASNPTTANQELIKRMSEIANKEVEVDALLNWEDLYQTIDYIYEGFYTHVRTHYGECLNEKEIQLCCLLRANFSTKEISIVIQQSVRTVYQRKTVVRQKLQLEEKGDIVESLLRRK